MSKFRLWSMAAAFTGSQSKRKQQPRKFLLLIEKRENFREYLQKRLTPKTGWAVKLKMNLSLPEMSHSTKAVLISLLYLLVLLQRKKNKTKTNTKNQTNPKDTNRKTKKICPNTHTKTQIHKKTSLFCKLFCNWEHQKKMLRSHSSTESNLCGCPLSCTEQSRNCDLWLQQELSEVFHDHLNGLTSLKPYSFSRVLQCFSTFLALN